MGIAEDGEEDLIRCIRTLKGSLGRTLHVQVLFLPQAIIKAKD